MRGLPPFAWRLAVARRGMGHFLVVVDRLRNVESDLHGNFFKFSI